MRERGDRVVIKMENVFFQDVMLSEFFSFTQSNRLNFRYVRVVGSDSPLCQVIGSYLNYEEKTTKKQA